LLGSYYAEVIRRNLGGVDTAHADPLIGSALLVERDGVTCEPIEQVRRRATEGQRQHLGYL
jgi:hypothetical protein